MITAEIRRVFFVQEERPRKSHWNYQKVDMSHFSAKKGASNFE